MEGIQVSIQPAGSANQISIIKVGGYIDTTTSSEVERALNSLLKQDSYQIIIDLGNVDYISSAGWGIFISEIKAIRENNGDLKLVQMIPDVYEIFELLEFHHILDVYDTVPAAVGKFEESQFVEMVSNSPSGTPQATPQEFSQPAKEPTVQPMGNPSQQNNNPETPQPQFREPTPLDLVNMPIEDKIKHVILNNPDIGAYKINKRLNSADFGFASAGWFATRSWLKKMDLNSRKKRRNFAKNSRNMY